MLVKAEPSGPTCHTGEQACFFTRLDERGGVESGKTADAHGALLEAIYRTVLDRKASKAEGSYVASLFESGQDRILKKVVEEAELKAIDREIKDEVSEAAEFAQNSPEPDPAELYTDVTA